MAETHCNSCGRDNPHGSRFCRSCGLLLGSAGKTVVLDLSEVAAVAAIGDYEIVGEIGKGGMGTVYRARHRTKGWDVALKVMRADVADDPKFVRRFVREARHLSSIHHPNLPRIYEFGKAPDGREFLAMEFIHGRSLIAYRDQGFEALYPIVCQICDGVAAIHAKGITHRDLSPDNILIVDGSPPLVKIIDFGIAKSAESGTSALTGAGTFMGKLEYCSPEQLGQLREGEEIDARSDIYSLGIILFQLLTGTLPFRGSTPMALMRAQLLEDPPNVDAVAPGRVPAGVSEILRDCLAKDRAARIATTLELKTRFQRVDARLRSQREAQLEQVRLARQAEERRRRLEELLLDRDRRRDEEQRRLKEEMQAAEQARLQAEAHPEGAQSAEAGRRLRQLRGLVQSTGPVVAKDVGPPGIAKEPDEPRPVRAWRWGLVAVGLSVFLLAGLVVLYSYRQRAASPPSAEGEGPSAEPRATARVTAPAPETHPPRGTLIVDALPWAEVGAVTDGNGRNWIEGRQFTPLRLELPPGSYRVRLKGSDGKDVETGVQVSHLKTTASLQRLAPIATKEFLERNGWTVQ